MAAGQPGSLAARHPYFQLIPLAWLLPPGDVAALKRILPKPKRQLGDAALQKLQQQAAEEGSTLARLLLGCCPALELQLFPPGGPLDQGLRDWGSVQRQLQAGLVGACGGCCACCWAVLTSACMAVLAACKVMHHSLLVWHISPPGGRWWLTWPLKASIERHD